MKILVWLLALALSPAGLAEVRIWAVGDCVRVNPVTGKLLEDRFHFALEACAISIPAVEDLVFVHDDRLQEVLAAGTSPEDACRDLIQAAKDAESNDNITCLVVKAAEPSWSDRVLGRLKPGRAKSLASI